MDSLCVQFFSVAASCNWILVSTIFSLNNHVWKGNEERTNRSRKIIHFISLFEYPVFSFLAFLLRSGERDWKHVSSFELGFRNCTTYPYSSNHRHLRAVLSRPKEVHCDHSLFDKILNAWNLQASYKFETFSEKKVNFCKTWNSKLMVLSGINGTMMSRRIDQMHIFNTNTINLCWPS